jgi:uncharacterized protein
MLRLKSYTSATGFLDQVQPYLERQEALTGLMLGLALHLVDEPLAYGSPAYLAAVMDGGEPLLAALMTPPHNLVLYTEQPESPTEVLELLAGDLIRKQARVNGTVGPAPLAEAFAGLWTGRTSALRQQGLNQRIYELTEVVHPRYSTGHLRLAARADAELVARWMDGFHDEASPHNPRLDPEMADFRIAERSVYLWDDDGPVSMACRTRPTRHGVSISWVYTPPELRRRGYATSCVAALSQQLLDSGFDFCTLFTDLSNPTSNDIYQQIGYRQLCDYQEIKFATGPD